ncbi:hypothetical protein Tco_1017851 [Tanacetum coccineum]|uniref:Uncharacterized protein n=1 Tax=Tanacetum coccineum TaxID=301880 RepID=A0ABQ5FSP3_9ASTR
MKLQCHNVIHSRISNGASLNSGDHPITKPNYNISIEDLLVRPVEVSDIDKRTKNEAKLDKTKHGFGKSREVKVKANKVNPDEVKVNPERNWAGSKNSGSKAGLRVKIGYLFSLTAKAQLAQCKEA